MAARNQTRTHALLAIAATMVGLVALNTLLGFVLTGARADLTQDRLYSSSAGVRALLAGLQEPVRLDFYWTQESSRDMPQIRAHGQRVREYLEELSRIARGKLIVRVIDPEPFSEAEDEARTAGLPALTTDGSGRTLTLGMVVRGPTDQRETIPYLSPDQEPFLEYELARAIASVGRSAKPTIGLLSSMPLNGGGDPRNPTQPRSPPLVIQQLRSVADVQEVDASAQALPEGLAALVLVQPRKLSPQMMRAIDAYALSGKPMVVLADPYAETDTGPDASAMGARRGGTTYDLGPLLTAWGVAIPPDMVVGDLKHATRIRAPMRNGGSRDLDYVAWLSMSHDQFAADDPLVGALQALNFMSAGSIEKLPGGTSNVEPLVTTSDQSQLIQTLKLGFFGDPEQLLRDFKADGAGKVLAARITGPIHSAFPAGAEEASGGSDAASAASAAARAPTATGNANIILIADADLLADDTWLVEDRAGGAAAGKRPIADNGPLVLNAIELAAGDPAIAQIRARGQYRRPFIVVEAMRKEAETRSIARERELQEELQRTELKIGELQRERSADGQQQIILTPEQAQEVQRLQQRMVAARKELRQVQHALRANVDALGNRLLITNAVLWPLLVAAAALGWYVLRGRGSRRESTP